MPSESKEEYLGTPLLEGATTLMLIGGNELGREILVEAHRLGLETVLLSDHQYAPATHLSHRTYVHSFDDEEALGALLRREQPDIIIQDSPGLAPLTIQNALEDHNPSVLPQLTVANSLQDRSKSLEIANNTKTAVVPFTVALSVDAIKESCARLGYPCFVSEVGMISESPEEVMKSEVDVDHLIREGKLAGPESRFLVRKFMPFDFGATQYVCASNLGSGRETLRLSRPIAILGTSDSPHVAWQPMWGVDEQTRMSAAPFSGFGAALHRKEEGPTRDYLWESEWNGRYITQDVMKEIEAKLKDYSIRILKKLFEGLAQPASGVFRLDFGVKLRAKEAGNKPEAYLKAVSPYMDETVFLTLATQQPTIPACVVMTALGISPPTILSTNSGVTHLIQAKQKSGWAPAFFNLNSACQEGAFVQLFGKHRFSASESVGVAYALDDDIIKARETALGCAHKVEEGIDYAR